MRIGRATLGDVSRLVLEREGRWYDLSAGSIIQLIRDQSLNPDYLGTALKDALEIPEPTRFELPYTPGKIVAIGRNYAEHAGELGNAIPKTPVLFSKSPDACIPDGAAIAFDPAIGRVDHEGEIALVIGRTVKKTDPPPPEDAIAGYTLLNDVTARGLQSADKERGLPWFRSKNLDTFCPFGPVIRLAHDLPFPPDLDIELSVNGITRQSGNTRQFIFDIPTMLEHITRYMTLHPGDLIATGTPSGVGPLAHGDTIELSSPQIGTLRNTVIAQPV